MLHREWTDLAQPRAPEAKRHLGGGAEEIRNCRQNIYMNADMSRRPGGWCCPRNSSRPAVAPGWRDARSPRRLSSPHPRPERLAYRISAPMKPAPFEYQAPRSLEAALAVLAERGGEAKVLA